MDEFIKFIINTNWQTILALFGVGWYFTKDIREEMKDIKNEMREQGKRIDHLYQICVDILKERKGG
jgi:hypothetical protein